MCLQDMKDQDNGPIKLEGEEDVKADDDYDTDDSDEELGNMIYESSRTAKKFREEEAKRKKESQSHLDNRKHTIDNNERTNTVVQEVAAPNQGAGQFQNIQMDSNRMHHHHRYQDQYNLVDVAFGSGSTHHHQSASSKNSQQVNSNRKSPERETTSATTESLLRKTCRQLLRAHGECTTDINNVQGDYTEENAPSSASLSQPQHHPQLFGGNMLQYYPQYQYPEYLPAPHMQPYHPQHHQQQQHLPPIIHTHPFSHQHQQYLRAVTTSAVPPGFTYLQTPVSNSLEPGNTNGNGSAASSSSNTKLKRKRNSPSWRHNVTIAYQVIHNMPSATAKRSCHRTCSHKDCTNLALNGGVCTRHGAKKYCKFICKFEGCTDIAVQSKGGVCSRHGAKDGVKVPKRKTCRHEGCTNNVVNGGVCKRHGAVVKKS